MKYIALIGRIFYSAIFLAAAPQHFKYSAIDYASRHGVPLPDLLVPFAGVLALVGGLSVLFGFKTKIGAWILIAFLVPVTFVMHNFWAVSDPQAVALQQNLFMKNLALMGGALLLAAFGAGPVSVDGQ
jgi:putative oxidoreductase